MWAWGNDDGGWTPMNQATSDQLEGAFQALPPGDNTDSRVALRVDQGHRTANYEVNLRKARQTNTGTGFRRAVRRFQLPGAGPPAQTWSWETDAAGGFWPCDADVSEWLTLARAKGWRTVRYWTDRCAFGCVPGLVLVVRWRFV